jgi:hypothetical protein
MSGLVPNSNGEDNSPVRLQEFNPCHAPAGSSAGGQFCASGAGGLYGSFEAFVAHARENLQRTSRTAKGVSDTSASADKPKLAAAEGEGLASQADRNFATTLKRVWDRAQRPMSLTPESLLGFVQEISGLVNAGLLQPGQSGLRTWVTKYPSTPPADIQTALSRFARELSARLRSPADPIATAAWVEKTFENIHPLADGVGRATKALSAFVLLRAGQRLPTYRDRTSYYANIGLDKPFESWLDYYRSLF